LRKHDERQLTPRVNASSAIKQRLLFFSIEERG
jgi:hypothetical protein